MERTRMAEPLPRALDVDADQVPFAHELASPPYRLAVALASANGEDAEPAQHRPEHRDLEELGLRQEVERPRRERADQRMVDRREVIRRDHAAALERNPLDAVAGGRRQRHRDARRDAAAEPPPPLDAPEPAQGIHGSSSRSRCSICATRSSSSSSSTRVTSPSSRNRADSPTPVRSPIRTPSLRQRPTSSSISPRASSRPMPPRADSSSARASARSAVSATAPTPASTSFSARSRSSAGAAMGPRASPLPPALALRRVGSRSAVDRANRREIRRGLGREGFLGGLELRGP